MAKKQQRGRPAHTPARAPSRQLLYDLNEVEALLDERKWAEARLLLGDLSQRYPNSKDVLALLVNLAYDQKDIETYQYAAEQLLRLTPDNVDLISGLVGAYLNNIRPALAIRTARHFIARWPDHLRAAELRKTVADLEPLVSAELEKFGLDGPDAFEVAARHEEVQSLLKQGRLPQARLLAEQVLRRNPDIIPVLNNLSLVCFLEGRAEEAIAAAERVLALDEDNFHALANLTHYRCVAGRMEDARQMAERLKAVVSEAPDVWLKKAEALSYLGDDEGVLSTLRSAERERDPTEMLPSLRHLAAVAAYRLGRETEARKYWLQAVKGAPQLTVAQDNLDDLRKPVGERHAPWAFVVAQWVPQATLDAYVKQVEPASQRGDAAVDTVHRRFIQRHPELIPLIPLLLDRGDPAARAFALRIAQSSDLPAVRAALRDFALGQRGPDAMRMAAAQTAKSAGLLPGGSVRLWSGGEWRDLHLLAWEIYDEPETDHAPEIEKKQREATQLLRDGKAERAEQILKQALEIAPDAPDLWNNLAAAYSQQGRVRDAELIVHQVHERHPDYFFGRTNLALLYIHDKRLGEAEALLAPLLSLSRLHTSEFDALMNVQIELQMARKDPDVARTWLNMWLQAAPDHPTAVMWQQRLKPSGRRWM